MPDEIRNLAATLAGSRPATGAADADAERAAPSGTAENVRAVS